MVTNRVLALKFSQGRSVEWIAEYHAVPRERVENAIRFYLYRRK
jgi:uncharacterized protein (DUF433 family)